MYIYHVVQISCSDQKTTKKKLALLVQVVSEKKNPVSKMNHKK